LPAVGFFLRGQRVVFRLDFPEADLAERNLQANFVDVFADAVNLQADDAARRLTALQGQLSGLRDTDITAAASQLTLDKTAYEAAIASQASLPTKSLFSYLG